MPNLSDSQVLDLVESVLRHQDRGGMRQIAQKFTEYEFMSRIMRRDKVQFRGGIGIRKNLMYRHSGAARQVGLYETDNLNVVDTLAHVTIDWRHTTTFWAWDRREALMATGPEEIVDIIKTRMLAGKLSLVEHGEEQAWNKPASSANTLDIFGMPYWVVKGATEGFNGLNPTGFAAGAGNVDSTAYPTWSNWTDLYTTVNKTDLITKMRKAHQRIGFKSPVGLPQFRGERGQTYRIYVNQDTELALEDVGEAQNENLGRDLAPYDGVLTFRRNPIIGVPQLNEDTSDPVYMIDTGSFYPVFLIGDYMRQSPQLGKADQHNVVYVFTDLTWNLICEDRRRQAVLAKSV